MRITARVVVAINADYSHRWINAEKLATVVDLEVEGRKGSRSEKPPGLIREGATEVRERGRYEREEMRMKKKRERERDEVLKRR